MSSEGSQTFIIIAGVIGNILSVVGVVICNKYIIEVDGFNFSVFLSFLHFAFTSLGTRVLLYGDYFKQNTAPISGILPVAIGSLLSVAFMNMNLAYNSVGFYQLSKLACIPFTLFVQYALYHQDISTYEKMTLIPITFGVGYATVYDLSLNTFGFVIASLAIAATAMAQIFTNTYQKSLNCDALQLLYHTSPYIAAGMLILCPCFDDVQALLQYQYSSACLLRIATSCFFALGVNISNYLVLGKTSPLTYQVLGHLKTILILVLGFTVFQKPVDLRNLIGITIAFVGVVAYTEVKRRQSQGSGSLPTSISSK
eukprot:gene2725-2902_t